VFTSFSVVHTVLSSDNSISAITIPHGATTILCKGLSNLLQVLNYTFDTCASCHIPTTRQVQYLHLKMAPFNTNIMLHTELISSRIIQIM